MKNIINKEPIDIVAEVATLLNEAGLGQEVKANYYTNKWVAEATPLVSEGQRFLLNRFWSLQLMNCEASTLDERFCLVENGEIEDWLRLFKDKVLPFCVEHRLPKQY